ncbi:MAG: serine/threonine protein kinase, partial [Acidobacteriota bacterium]|nr:serine/threonine protein kinase [Acidobacteriota bacterium]
MPFPQGARVGPYEVLNQLGAGGMGEVYRAHDPRLGRDIALKVIRRALVTDTGAEEDALERLLREATLASALNHPNIVTIHETGTVGTDRYIAMEFVEGRTLRQLAADGLSIERAISIARQIAEALAVAHAAQIVHRDIKPDNVMVSDEFAMVTDFGVAKAVSASAKGEAGTSGAL